MAVGDGQRLVAAQEKLRLTKRRRELLSEERHGAEIAGERELTEEWGSLKRIAATRRKRKSRFASDLGA